jgi:MFS family permease
MLGSYRRLFSAKGSVAFTLAGLLARLPMGMFGVSIVLLVADTSGSFAVAGGVSAAGLVGVAICAPLIGRLVDRYGQARIAVPASTISVIACTGTILCAEYGAPTWTLYVTYIASAVVPFVNTMARARWVRIYQGQPDMLHVANSFERIVDELVFISGPALAAALCGLIHPAAGLITANFLLMVGTLLFAAQRSTEPTPLAPEGGGAPRRLLVPGLSAAVALFPILGIAVGAMEVVTVAYITLEGSRSYSGVFLALVGLGACLSGLFFGTLKLKSGTRRRTLGLSAILSVCLLPVPLLIGDNLLLFGLWAFIVGSAVAPMMITSMGLLQELTPEERMNEGMSLADAGLVVGMAVGAATGGTVATHYGETSGFWIVSGAGLLALLVTGAGARWWKAPDVPQRQPSRSGRPQPSRSGAS